MIDGDAHIRCIGYIDRIEDVYASSDIVVVPSRWQEPLGLIAIEAAACGKPVVATRVGGLPEIIEDGRTGFLVEPEAPEQLGTCVTRLAHDAALRCDIGGAGRQRVKGVFSTQPVRAFEDVLLATMTRGSQ